MTFTHLHVHTAYSLLDGFSDVKKLVNRVKEMGMPAVAITDHGTMFGVIEFFNAATVAGVKPIIGLETYLAARSMRDRDARLDKQSSHLLLLAENMTGYRNLLAIASAGQLEGFYYYPRVDKEFLAAHAEGLIATTGCMAAEIPRAIVNGGAEAARQKLDWYYEVFGAENFFLELQDHQIKELPTINKTLLSLGSRYQARYVATNDVHYINPEDARLQDILLCIQTGSLLSDPNRFRMSDSSYYLRSPEEMRVLFAEAPEAITNTLLIAERCQVDLSSTGYHLPLFDVPEGFTPETYLRKLCDEGLPRCFGERATSPEVRQRLDYELKIIHDMGFDTYFLIVWDLCCYARDQGIWYNARGSGAGSLVAYSLDITNVDPLEQGLIFERFLNPGRISMPDIDLDFQDNRRSQMMEFCANKYGNDKVAQIITFGTLGARAAIRDVGRVMDIPISEVDRVAKMVPNIPGKPVSIVEALDEVTEFKAVTEEAPYLKELVETAAKMEGAIRNAGTHAAGVVITDKPVIEYVPLHRPTSGSVESPIKSVTQFEMSIIESLGLLKVDFLGLATLTIMANACRLIRERRGIDLSLHNIPTRDPETYKFIGEGHTAGVFQLEGTGMSRYITQMKPTALAHVIAMVALYRPGPLEFIPSYIKRMHGEEKIIYRHAALEPILKETYGITVYQEQIMFTAMNLAGYTATDADNLRKGVAKKKADVLLKHRQTFVQGATERGIPEETANKIFDDWEAFARYGFPKGHAADYGVIAVQTAYLKAHYTVEYMTALLSSTKNETEKVAFYVADCRSMGIPVLAPDVNSSGWDFTIEDQPDGVSAIRFGLGAVKNVGLAPVEAILEGRRGGRFKSLTDFAKRVDLRSMGKRSLESLIRVGALDSFGPRLALLEAIDRILALSASHFRALQMGQMNLFGELAGVNDELTLNASAAMDRREQLSWERELMGLYVSDHPISVYLPALQKKISHFSGQLGEAGSKDKVIVAGLITRIRNHQTKTGKAMGFVSIEDIQGVIELVLFPRTWDKYSELIQVDSVITVEGKVDAEQGDPKVLVDRVVLETEATLAAPQQEASIIPSQNNSLIPDRLPAIVRQTFSEPDAPRINPRPDFPDLRVEQNDDDETEKEWDDWDQLPPPTEPGNDIWDPAPSTAAQAESAPASAEPPRGEQVAASKQIAELSTVDSYRPNIVLPPYIITPKVTGSEVENPADQPRMITVILRTSGDKKRDALQVRRIHALLMTFPGNDRFAFHLFEKGQGYIMEFPNETTGICSEMIDKLKSMVGEHNFRVNLIKVQ